MAHVPVHGHVVSSEAPNETTGVAPWTLIMGHLLRCPLAILKDSWCDKELPISFG